jgi:CMP-N-acetylneuraminic acid synthetase
MGIIPARANSKGLPGKNKRMVGGKELVRYTLETADSCKLLDKIAVSTDDDDIMSMAREYRRVEVPFKRPAGLAGDKAQTIDVVRHVLDFYKEQGYIPDAVVLLQVTSPMRTAADIRNCLDLIGANPDIDSVVSVEKIDEPHPYKMKTISAAGYLQPLIEGTSSEIPRQLLPPVYKLNGAIYLSRIENIYSRHSLFGAQCLPYLMHGSINIDGEEDLNAFARFVARQNLAAQGY